MKPIEFEVLFWEREQNALNDLGIRPNIKEADTRPVTFYRIDAISPYYEDDDSTEMCCIYSGNEEYIVNKKYNTVKQLLA